MGTTTKRMKENLTHVTVKAGKFNVGGMELSSAEVIPELESDKVYMFLHILETNDIIQTEIKYKISKKYYRRVRWLTPSKLNGGNTIRATNFQVVSSVRYSAGILKRRMDELKVKGKTTQKIMTVDRKCTICRVTVTDCTFQEWKVEIGSSTSQTVYKLKNKMFIYI